MPQPNKPDLSVVDPDAPFVRGSMTMAERLLIGGRCLPEDARWLAPLLLEVLPNADRSGTALSDETEGHFGLLALAWHLSEGDRDAAFMILLASLSNCIHVPRLLTPTPDRAFSEPWIMPEPAGEKLVAEFIAHGVDFNRVLIQGWPKHIRDEWKRDNGAGVRERYESFFRLLLRTGAVDLPRIVDLESLRESGRRGMWSPVGFSMSAVGVVWDDGISWLDSRSLRVWTWFTGGEALLRFLPAYTAEPAETLPALSCAVAQVTATWVGRPGHGRAYHEFDDAGVPLARVMRGYFDHLDTVHDGQNSLALHEAWMLFFRMAWDAEADHCPEPLRKRMVEQATEDLSKLRKLLAAATSEGDTPQSREFAAGRWHLESCALILSRYGGIWRCMKPLLLALRALGTRAVAMDLRYWPEFVQDPLPEPWSAIPATMINLFHMFAGREQAKDPELKELRTQLALFLLEKLTDRWSKSEREQAESDGRLRTESDMREPKAMWRYCCIRAVMDLHINPEGRGHKALRWSADHDPSPRVREAARRGHDELRHTRGLSAKMSPRRSVLAALWWYRQGHLLGLGLQPDDERARRTREKELTRTKEVERADNPAAG